MKHIVDPHEFPGLEVLMHQIGDKIAAALPPDVGFAFFTFHYDEGGVAYMSNGKREDIVKLLQEWIETVGAEDGRTTR
jgi:hypothetical protein